MSNCPGCDNSSTTYSRCNPPVSTNCVFYQGDSKVCPNDTTFTICKGDNLSKQQLSIFNKICSLIGNIDITTIEIPICFYESWNAQNPRESDKTILNLLEYMLDVQCEQKQLIDSVNSQLPTLNPQVEVCLACCTPGCTTDTPVVLLLSEALAAIVSCVCTAKTTAENALTIAQDAFYQSDIVLKTQVDAQQLLITSLLQQNIAIQTRLCKIEKYFQNLGTELPAC